MTALVALGHPQAESSHRSPLRLENGLLINKGAGYYFAVPDGWVLDAASKSDNVKLVHPGSGAEFSVGYWYSTGTSGMNYTAFRLSLEAPDYHWLTVGKGSMPLGGRDAMCYRGTRDREGRKVKEIDWLAEVDEYVYYLAATVDLDKFDARVAEIDRMYSSFAWGAPPKTP